MLAPEQGSKFGQGDVLLRLDRMQDHVPECLDTMGPEVATFTLRGQGASGSKHPHPTDGSRNTDAEPLGCGTP